MLDFFVNLKCQTSTITISLGVKYPMRDHIFDANYCLRVYAVWRFGSYNADNVNTSCCIISSFSKSM